MTWKEFKDRVEAAGVVDSDNIGMIDMVDSWPFVIAIEQDVKGGPRTVDMSYADDES